MNSVESSCVFGTAVKLFHQKRDPINRVRLLPLSLSLSFYFSCSLSLPLSLDVDKPDGGRLDDPYDEKEAMIEAS